MMPAHGSGDQRLAARRGFLREEVVGRPVPRAREEEDGQRLRRAIRATAARVQSFNC